MSKNPDAHVQPTTASHVQVALSPSDFRSVADDFVRNFSLLLHTVLTIQKVRHDVIAVVLAALT